MKKWIVRFVCLLAFNVVLLLVIGWLTPAKVGWSAIWAGVILTAATLWLKPLITKMFQGMARKSANQRTKLAEKLVQYVSVFVVALVVWIVTLLLSGVTAGDWLWSYVLPPIFILIGWAIYDAIDDRVEAHAHAAVDQITGGKSRDASAATDAPAVPSAEAQAGARELKDGLTDEQRKLLDEL